jgi:hypothetical protein
MSMRTLSNVAKIHPALATTPVISGKFLAWTIFAGILVAIAIYAIAISPPPDVDGLAMMSLIGP